MMLHIHYHPSTTPLEEIKELIKKSWRAAALKVWAFVATYHEKTNKERKWSGDALKLIYETCPEEYKTGVHVLSEHGGFMGEDVCMVDGRLQDTMHARHKICKKYQLVDRGKENEPDRFWCIFCAHDLPRSEVQLYVEEVKEK